MRGNPFLGELYGRCGDVTFYRLRGQQVGRTINLHPHNPRTDTQVLSRLLLKTVSSAYSLLSPLSSCSWQGISGVTPNHNQFVSVNLGRLRSYAMQSVTKPSDIYDSQQCNYLGRHQRGCCYYDWQISYGSLPTMSATMVNGMPSLGPFNVPLADGFTYSDLASALGLELGDKLHLFTLFIDDSGPTGKFSAASLAVVVLMPASGDGSVPFLASDGGVASPNTGNAGTVYFARSDEGIYLNFWPFYLHFDGAGTTSALAACACVCSRLSSMSLYSTETLSIRQTASPAGGLRYDHFALPMSAAAYSFG